MPSKRYAVIHCGEEWRVVSRDRQMGHFTSRDEAVLVATGLAEEAQKAGFEVELLLHSPSGVLVPDLAPPCVGEAESASGAGPEEAFVRS